MIPLGPIPLGPKSADGAVDNPVGIVDNPPGRWLRRGERVLTQQARSARRVMSSSALGLVLQVIRGYQRWISPGLAPRCRFYPSCSSYAVQAMSVHGLGRGGVLAVRRLLRCHPWNPGGPDPVPRPRAAGEHGRPTSFASRLSPCKNTPGA